MCWGVGEMSRDVGRSVGSVLGYEEMWGEVCEYEKVWGEVWKMCWSVGEGVGRGMVSFLPILSRSNQPIFELQAI